MTTTTSHSTPGNWRTPTLVLVCSGLILTLAMGIRHGFGLFLQPISADMHWGRETFALALAVQNLVWGATQPFAGAIADKYGTARVIVFGLIVYAAGLVLMVVSPSALLLDLTAGILCGVGIATSSFSIVMVAFGRNVPQEKRSLIFGVATAHEQGTFKRVRGTPLPMWIFLGAWVAATVLTASSCRRPQTGHH